MTDSKPPLSPMDCQDFTRIAPLWFSSQGWKTQDKKNAHTVQVKETRTDMPQPSPKFHHTTQIMLQLVAYCLCWVFVLFCFAYWRIYIFNKPFESVSVLDFKLLLLIASGCFMGSNKQKGRQTFQGVFLHDAHVVMESKWSSLLPTLPLNVGSDNFSSGHFCQYLFYMANICFTAF